MTRDEQPDATVIPESFKPHLANRVDCGKGRLILSNNVIGFEGHVDDLRSKEDCFFIVLGLDSGLEELFNVFKGFKTLFVSSNVEDVHGVTTVYTDMVNSVKNANVVFLLYGDRSLDVIPDKLIEEMKENNSTPASKVLTAHVDPETHRYTLL